MKKVFLMVLLSVIVVSSAQAQVSLPGVQVQLGGAGGEGYSTVVKLMVLLTVLSLAPAILIMMTSFTRVIVVLAFLRQAFGTQQLPPNQMLIGLALFLTYFVMAPVFQEINQTSLQPYLSKQMNEEDALKTSERSIRDFMFRQTGESELGSFLKLANSAKPQTRADVPTWVLIPSFMISELKKAFRIGFMIYLPFLVLDMVVASVLMAMGMMMLPPVMISLPFKLLLFVLVDGWQLVVGSLVKSFGGP